MGNYLIGTNSIEDFNHLIEYFKNNKSRINLYVLISGDTLLCAKIKNGDVSYSLDRKGGPGNLSYFAPFASCASNIKEHLKTKHEPHI